MGDGIDCTSERLQESVVRENVTNACFGEIASHRLVLGEWNIAICTDRDMRRPVWCKRSAGHQATYYPQLRWFSASPACESTCIAHIWPVDQDVLLVGALLPGNPSWRSDPLRAVSRAAASEFFEGIGGRRALLHTVGSTLSPRMMTTQPNSVRLVGDESGLTLARGSK